MKRALIVFSIFIFGNIGLFALPRSFTDNGDNTITDNVTGLIWQKCSMGQNQDNNCSGTAIRAYWQGSLQYCDGLALAGRTWRLPSIKELMSIVDKSQHSPAIDTTYFPGSAGAYWSSTTDVTLGPPFYESAYFMNLVNGYILSFPKASYDFFVRCVSGP